MTTLANPQPFGPLNTAPTFDALTPGPRGKHLLITKDGRILLLRAHEDNALLIPNPTGLPWWYEYRREKVLTWGTDYPVTRKPDKNWVHGFDFELPTLPQDMGECWEVDFGHTKFDFRNERKAREAARIHKEQFGGVGGTYEPAGWYPIRALSDEEKSLLK